MLAAYRGHEDIVVELLAHNASLDRVGNAKGTALSAAQSGNHKDIAKRLITLKPELLKVYSAKGETPLLRACRTKNKDFINLYLEAGADVNAKDRDGNSCLLHALKNRNFTLAARLMAKNVEAEEKDRLLTWAAKEQNQHAAEFLLQNGANPNSQQHDKQPPLLYAVMNDDFAMARLLLDNGAYIEIETSYMTTPLIEAVLLHNYAFVKFLLEEGADMHRTNSVGNSAYFFAARDEFTDILELFANPPMTRAEALRFRAQPALIAKKDIITKEGKVTELGLKIIGDKDWFADFITSSSINLQDKKAFFLKAKGNLSQTDKNVAIAVLLHEAYRLKSLQADIKQEKTRDER